MTLPPLNIWFNRSFATTFWTIQMIRDNPDKTPVTIFATHADAASPVLEAADFKGIESEATGEEYILWALDYCTTNSIKVFIPRNNIEIIAENISRFEALGVIVLASPAADIRLLEDKGLTYAKAQEVGIPVPPYYVASTADTILESYEKLRSELASTIPIVIKPTVGVGASGFRVINDDIYKVDNLVNSKSEKVGIKDIVGAYQFAEKTGGEAPELLILPWLDAPEVSVDCLSNTNGDLVRMIPRIKEGGRITTFSNRYPEATATVERWYENFDLRYLTNTQLRWWEGEVVLLETNTRAAGGLYATTLTGVNMMWEAISYALGNEPVLTEPKLDHSYVSLSSFVPITT